MVMVLIFVDGHGSCYFQVGGLIVFSGRKGARERELEVQVGAKLPQNPAQKQSNQTTVLTTKLGDSDPTFS